MKDSSAKRIVNLRPPIVSVLGHVDHGKTTLLDFIRKTSVASHEAGGITQSIGASVVTSKGGGKITFIDTPGHAAFGKMRSRGAKVCDIAILVVAANDGIKPQTKEALKFIKEASIPFIVAITKIDLPAIDIDAVKDQLANEGVNLEGKGGDVPVVCVSGKTGKGVKDLLEMITLVSEINNIKGDPKASLEAVVIETDKDKRGLLVSAVIRNGTLKAGDEIVAADVEVKVRGLFDSFSKSVREVFPGEPVQILGFSKFPAVGSNIILKKDVPQTSKKKEGVLQKRIIPVVKKGQIPVVIKASSAGSLEAILANIPEGIVVIHSEVGDVIEGDVFLAKSANDALIIAFEAKAPSSVSKLADTEGVKIETFSIIYKLFDRLTELLKQKEVEVLGKAEILATFPFNNKKVAGCKVLQGKISKTDNFIVMRDEKEIGKARAVSMKKEKKNIEEAKTGEEFGVIFDKKLDFELGDMLISTR